MRKPGIQEKGIENEGSIPAFLASSSLFRGSSRSGDCEIAERFGAALSSFRSPDFLIS
jgi:hypothetical protein